MQGQLAIVGMACRVPGARDYRTLWTNVEAGRTGMVDVTDQDLRHERIVAPEDARNPYVAVAAPLDDYDRFDHAAFGITAGEARGMNVNHRVMMEVVLEALEDAGCDPVRHPGRIGLVAAGGTGSPIMVLDRLGDSRYGDPSRPLKPSEAVNWVALLDHDFLTTRIAYALDLRGPSMTVQSACSSSLVALHVASRSLLADDCDVAVVGGVNIEHPQRAGYYHQPGSIWSTDGSCRPFDRAASGTITASGAGAVVLKRLDRAVADGDEIHAVVRGSAVNNDGRHKAAFAAPSVRQQSQVIADALAAAGLDPADIGYLEAHGTATEIGDLVEWEGIARALGTDGVRCALGAVKANVGHLGAAAGIVGLIKAALVVGRGRIPPVANFVELNPRITRNDRMFVPSTPLDWVDDGRPRRAGVSSMGVGGTNAHVVLEQAPPPMVPDVPADTARDWYVVPVSGATPASAEATADRVVDFAVGRVGDIDRLARTMSTGRRVLAHRQAAVIDVRNGRAEAWRTGVRQAERHPQPAFVFPGQGTALGDLSAARTGIEGFDDLLAEALADLAADHRQPVTDRLTGGDAAPALVEELAVLVGSVVTARSLVADGLAPRFVCGYSLGEVAAAVVADVVTLADAAAALSERARILASAPTGAMIRVRLPEEAAAAYLREGVSLAIVPGAGDCVLAGTSAGIDEVAAELRAVRIASLRIPVAHPFHSAVLEPFLAEYTAVWQRLELRAPALRVMSATTGTWLDDATARHPAYWAGHLVRTVRFRDGLNALRSEGAGPVYVLDSAAGLVSFTREVFGNDTVAMTTADRAGYDPISRARLLATAWTAGQDVLPSPGPGRLVHAPTYAFDHSIEETQPMAIEPLPPAAPVPAAAPVAPPVAVPPVAPPAAVPPASPAAASVPPEGLGAAVREVVAELVGTSVEAIQPDASFMDVGYDSFQLIQLADALSSRFGVDVDARQLYFERDTSAELTSYLADLGAGHSGAEAQVVDEVRDAAEVPVVTAAPQLPLDETVPDREQEWSRRTQVSKRVTEEDRFALADQRNVIFSLRTGRREVTYPVVGVRGEGAHFTDVDGHEYLDLCMGFGVTLLGHGSQPVTDALRAFEPSDLLLGPQSSTAGDVARGIAALTGVDRVGFASSGTEAVMAAVRAARAGTGRDLIAMFSGAFHGTFDGVMVAPKAGGTAGETTTIGRGTPAGMVRDVVLLPYDETAIPILESYGERLAGVLVEPVQSRRPGYQPRELLHRLRTLTTGVGAALIFDEIITGFRSHPAGAAGLFGVRPDLVTYGKVIGGGMPIGVVGGTADFMAPIDGGRWRQGDARPPERPSMVFSGTFSKQPMAMAVAQEMIAYLRRRSPRLQADLNRRTADLAAAVNAHCEARGYPVSIQHFSSLFRIDVGGGERAENVFFLGLLGRGVYVWEGRTCFLSAAHDDADCARIVEAVADAAAEVAASGLWRRAGDVPAPVTQPAPDLADGAGPSGGEAPLTDGQKLLWMSSELGGDREASYRMSDVRRVHGRIDQARMAAALAQVARRHEALRIGFEPDGTAQFCLAHSTPGLEVVSVDGAADAEAALDRFARRSVDMAEPSLFGFQLVIGPDASFLQATAPHAIVDGWSFEVLWEELSACYLGHGETLAAPASFLDYARGKRADEDARFEDNSAQWRSRIDGAWRAGRAIDAAGPFTPSTRVDELAGESSADLGALARDAGVTMHTAALAAVAAAARLLTGVPQIVVMTHRTEQPHVAGPLVGFCVDQLPVVVDLPDHCSVLEVARAVREQLATTSHATSGLYRLLQDPRYRELPSSFLAFEYARQGPGELFGFRAEPVSRPRDSMPRPALLTVESTQGGLELISEVSPASDLAAHADRLADALRLVLSRRDVSLGELAAKSDRAS